MAGYGVPAPASPVMRLHKILDRVSATMVMLAMVVSGFSVAIIITVNSVDTIGRALFSKPLMGAVEITELFLAMCIVLAIPYAQRTLAHIEIDMFKQRCGPRARKALVLVAILITMLVFLMLAVQSYDSARVSVATLEFSAGYLRVPIWIGKVAVAVGFAVAFFESVTQLVGFLLFGNLTRTETPKSAH
jgi:TRAP-type C4-dicarboxylate transport system permease small subunit